MMNEKVVCSHCKKEFEYHPKEKKFVGYAQIASVVCKHCNKPTNDMWTKTTSELDGL